MHLIVNQEIEGSNPFRVASEKGQRMADKLDRFGNPIKLWDKVVYSGSSVGLVAGIVVKINPKSFKVKAFKKSNYSGKEYFYYYDVPFTSKNSLIKIESVNAIDPRDFLSDVEARRMEDA